MRAACASSACWRRGERSVQELASALDLKEPTISHHLAILKAQASSPRAPDGTTRWHALDRGALARLSKRVLQPETAAPLPPRNARDPDAEVLRNFVDAEGRLKSIPAARKKRGAVLRWLMRDFAGGKRYSEAQINAAIQAHHWDSATLRRG